MDEKRRYKRWQIDKAAHCRFADRALSCSLIDVSFKGAKIFLEAAQLNLGKSCDLTIKIIHELEPISIGCDVIWQNQRDRNVELGLYFSRIKDNDKERIFRYVFDYFPEQITKQWWS